MGRFENVSILDIYTTMDTKKWNRFLASCLIKNDMKLLMETYKGLQLDMDDLVSQKLNTEKVNVFFIRLTRSIEKTAKKLWNRAYYKEGMPPNQKRIIDNKFEEFLRKESF